MKLSSLTEFFISHLQGMRKSQIKTLAALVHSVITNLRVGVAAIGRGMATRAHPKHRIKRVDRFLGNLRIQIPNAVRSLIFWLLNNKERAFIAIDWTHLKDGIHIMLKAAVAGKKGRAIPILWRIVREEDLTLNQNRIEEDFLRELKTLIPPNVKQVIIIGDRGFPRVELFRFLEELGFHYVIRVKTNVWVRGKDYEGNLGDIKVRWGQVIDLGKVQYRKRDPVITRVVISFGKGHEEPWLLATDLGEDAGKIIGYYAKRMEIDEFFRDAKSSRYGFSLEHVKLSCPERYERMMLILAYAYFMLTLAGEFGEQRGLHRRLMANTAKKRTLALWRVGGYVLQHGRVHISWLLNLIPEVIFTGT